MGQDIEDTNGHFANYSEYSKTLRSWLVAYGIGGPILFLTSKDAAAKIAGSPHFKLIITLLMVGVCLQILLAFINKWAAWHMYRGAYSKELETRNLDPNETHHKSKSYKIWHWINKQSWIDFCVDLGALLSFSIATWFILTTLFASNVAP